MRLYDPIIQQSITDNSESPVLTVGDLKITHRDRIPTYVIDEFLMGGFPKGDVIIVHGEKGSFKTTLFVQILAMQANANKTAVLVEAEENPPSGLFERLGTFILMDFTRIKIVAPRKINDDLTFEYMISELDKIKDIDFVVVDSMNDLIIRTDKGRIEGLYSKVITMYDYLKKRRIAGALIMHENKKGNITGLEDMTHKVDAVLKITSVVDKKLNLKDCLITAEKNRGSRWIQVKLKMGDKGLKALPLLVT